ncbi:hypothetical protein CHS0354_003437 [Potamilus streckersoni]|uniref:Cytidyltransferase-like domain-containing protein n=1 Tax=Potamilus streckersoni TaxID=2493646 RepID=A0AAE0SPB9_9BIVA|nr:hypothetical protein CHS0354_003437 [Potamilus streckersoni]
MFQTGLLIVTQPLLASRSRIPLYLSRIKTLIQNTLYVHIQPVTPRAVLDVTNFNLEQVPYTPCVRSFIREFYSKSASLCKNLDVRILLNHISNKPLQNLTYSLHNHCDIVFIDQDSKLIDGPISSMNGLFKCLEKSFMLGKGVEFKLIGSWIANDGLHTVTEKEAEDELIKMYYHTVLGGTFDRLHTGHKVLLSEGALLSQNSLTVGVTVQAMNQKKILHDLIQSIDVRQKAVEEFLTDVKSCLTYKILPIDDIFGPTVKDSKLECIVVSEETKKGGELINQEREKRSMSRLDEYVIELMEDDARLSQYEEEKISSSTSRKRLLGTLLHQPPPRPELSTHPYVIGLTGGIASGKTSVCQRLEKLGAGVVDCDKLGHVVYLNGTPAYVKLVAEFGQEILREDGEINRKALGAKVFADKSLLEKLNSIVWPEIGRLAAEKIQQFQKEGKSVVVLEAALLLEAGWDNIVHEVWTNIIPPAEAVRRITTERNLSEEEAKKRLESQLIEPGNFYSRDFYKPDEFGPRM